ncbi:MAG: DNA polymerase III subunit delta [Rubrivivax sp.]|nr:DNA polymerase III subunit delta [Rubrivivax sp.]
MQLRPEQLEAHLAHVAKGPAGLKPLYTLHGDEPLLAQEAADALRAAARAAGFAERKVFTVAGAHFDWSAVLGAAQAMSLFAERQLIEIRIPSGKPGKDGSEALQRYCAEVCERIPEDVLTIVQLPRLDFQQAKSAWFGALEAAGVVVRFDPIERRALPAWLAQRLARQGQRVADGEEGERTLAFFADRVEGNLLAAHQELQKIALLYPGGPLGFEQVEAAVLDVARYDIARLVEAVWSGRAARALRMLDALEAEGESAVFVHWALAEDVRALARTRAAVDAGQPLPMALREARVWGTKEKLFERLVPQLAAPELARWLQAAHVCDGLCKGLTHPGWPSGAWPALQHWVLMLLRSPSGARRPLALHG